LVAAVVVGKIIRSIPVLVCSLESCYIAIPVVADLFLIVFAVTQPLTRVILMIPLNEPVQPVISKAIALFTFLGRVSDHTGDIAVILQRITAVKSRFG